jgi:hypothetical protein
MQDEILIENHVCRIKDGKARIHTDELDGAVYLEVDPAANGRLVRCTGTLSELEPFEFDSKREEGVRIKGYRAKFDGTIKLDRIYTVEGLIKPEKSRTV